MKTERLVKCKTLFCFKWGIGGEECECRWHHKKSVEDCCNDHYPKGHSAGINLPCVCTNPSCQCHEAGREEVYHFRCVVCEKNLSVKVLKDAPIEAQTMALKRLIEHDCRPEQKEECKVPPKGWRCTRGKGHEGPCAAIPEEECLCGDRKENDGIVHRTIGPCYHKESYDIVYPPPSLQDWEAKFEEIFGTENSSVFDEEQEIAIKEFISSLLSSVRKEDSREVWRKMQEAFDAAHSDRDLNTL